MQNKLNKAVFVLWILAIAVHFSFFLYKAEYYAKMHIHDTDAAVNLVLALVTAAVFGVLFLLKKIKVQWLFIPVLYGLAGFIMDAVYSAIPCCVGG